MEYFIDTQIWRSDLRHINSLLNQLNPNAARLTDETLECIMGRSHIFLARLGNVETAPLRHYLKEAVGMACLVPIAIPAGLYGRIEDVVVDEKYRGQGIAEKLMEEIKKSAKAMGLKHLDLTSRPDRIAANSLYQKIGFEKRKTNVYRFKLT